jgi:CheY-like chemotaxis protein
MKCLAAAMDDYLEKPFSASEFQAMLIKWSKQADLV